MKKKILYISYDGLTDPLGQSQIIPYLAGLSSKYAITIISCDKKTNYKLNGNAIKTILGKKGINWHSLEYTKKPPVLSTLFDILRIWKRAKMLQKEENFSIVHCRSYIPSLIGLWMKKKYGIKFIFDMRGFWADERVEGGLWNLKNPVFSIIYRYFKKKEREFLLNADSIISLTTNAKNEIDSWRLSDHPLPVHIIPCCVDTELFSFQKVSDEEKKHLRKLLQINDKTFLVSYLGAVGTWYLIEEMLLFFKFLLNEKPFAKFLFITHENPQIILSKASELQLPTEQIIIKKAGRNEVPALISLSAISLFFIKPVFSKKASSPTKLGEIMAMGIPVICNSGVGDVESIIRETQSGILIDKFNEEKYTYAVQHIENLVMQPKLKIREGALRLFSLEQGIHNYEKVYSRCLNL